MTLAPNDEQRAAIDATGVVFVSAGAGTGKTSVLVERFARAVVDRGVSVDALLVITYTDRAAEELRARIRARLVELGHRELAVELDRAWISTIHGFCSRLLRSHPLEAGVDPRFRTLDENQARVLRSNAFDEALAAFCAGRDEERLRLLAAYTSANLKTMLTGVFERLRSAGRRLVLAAEGSGDLRASREVLQRIAGEVRSADAGEEEVSLAGWLLGILDTDPSPESLLGLSRQIPRRKKHLAELREAAAGLERAALGVVSARDRGLLQELLTAFDHAYGCAKERESALDFEDLQLRARDLLREHEDVRESLAWRFRSIMVDEFQDTDRLQCDLIDLIVSDELFSVGDELQSIYRFRHADVDVFRQRRERSGGPLALTQNYRSRPEVLDVVNHIFERQFGESFERLVAARQPAEAPSGPAVEVLVTDKTAYNGRPLTWREGEARHLASRLSALIARGECTPGDVVILLAAGTSAEDYEAALRERGLPTHRATRHSYYDQQQVRDLLAYLALLQNRYDDVALLAVLASPLVGVSNDALLLLRRSAGKRPLFSGLERELPSGLASSDVQLMAAFRQRYDRLVLASEELGLEALCERIITEHDYDLAVLAAWDGQRRYANVRTLMLLARSFEDRRGADLEGFLTFARSLTELGAREGEAVEEDEEADAIRLMTIHAAKGLEFKVVAVADCGRERRRVSKSDILCLLDEEGPRFGLSVADPNTGARHPAPGYEEIRAAEDKEEEDEGKRLYYVAMTRAIDRLIVSGALDPSRNSSWATPIGWVLESLDASLEQDEPTENGTTEIPIGGASVMLRVDRGGVPDELAEPQEAERVPSPADEQLELFDPAAPVPEPDVAPSLALPALRVVPAAPRYQVTRLSFSALTLYGRCSLRFWAERFVGLKPRAVEQGMAGVKGGLNPLEFGEAVHGLIELVASQGDVEQGDVKRWLTKRYPHAGAEDVERAGCQLAGWRGSALAASVGAKSTARAELGFAFEHEGILLHGRFDLYARAGDDAIVVDFKTNRLDDVSPKELVDRDYAYQVVVYALAALKAGASTVTTQYVFLDRPEEPVGRTFARDDLAELEGRLSEAIAAIRRAEFRATPGKLVCAECPLLDVTCAGPALLEHPEPSEPTVHTVAGISEPAGGWPVAM
ncbi:MAG: UvrD-helicase domain-containing protein [Actinomycetia bacterium]|nr:UvrD-helicase domain-containing protein [Actinomycetes bacterium]